jgi:hypothetical protein
VNAAPHSDGAAFFWMAEPRHVTFNFESSERKRNRGDYNAIMPAIMSDFLCTWRIAERD